ncbi:hypothetical protein ACFE04_008095 [Oxalis oulophora]
MAKQKSNANNITSNNNNSSTTITSNGVKKVKRTRRSVPRDSPPQRSSIYRGVTRHRWTGRYEAHLWDKNCWNESQNKKGRQVYLGAYDDEDAAAHSYDLAALKYWGPDTILNFPLSTYTKELQDMDGQSREEYIGSLRRKSSGFSRGVSKYRGVARHHHNGRWEARIGRVFGNKYLYLGTYATQEEAATAYDMAAIEYRGLNAVTNFDLSRYIKWLKPNSNNNNNTNINILPNPNPNPNLDVDPTQTLTPNLLDNNELNLTFFHHNELQPSTSNTEVSSNQLPTQPQPTTATSALGLLLQSSKFKEMMEMTSTIDDDNLYCSSTTLMPMDLNPTPDQCTFPDDIQTYFECQDNSYSSSTFGEGGDDNIFFGDLNSFVPPNFHCQFD